MRRLICLSTVVVLLAVPAAAALRPRGDSQVVDGFASLVDASNLGSYQTYRGEAVLSYWEYAGFNQAVTWQTAPVPSSYTQGRLTFIWSGANGIGVGADISAIYEAHHKTITQATKDAIRRDLSR